MARGAGVYGGAAVAGKLRRLPERLTPGVVGKLRKAALAPMLASAKEHLIANRSVHRRVLLDGMVIADKGRNASAVIASGPAVRIAHLVEFGTRAHWQPRRKVMHPGARPFPFLRPAYEETRSEVVAELEQSLTAVIGAGLTKP